MNYFRNIINKYYTIYLLKNANDNIKIFNLEAGYTAAMAETLIKKKAREVSGYFLQAGVFAMKDVLQIWGKYEILSEENDFIEGNLQYLHLGINVFPRKSHKIKMQAGYQMGLNTMGIASDQINKDLGLEDDWFALQLQITY